MMPKYQVDTKWGARTYEADKVEVVDGCLVFSKKLPVLDTSEDMIIFILNPDEWASLAMVTYPIYLKRKEKGK